MTTLSLRTLGLIAALSSLALLCGAWIAQYGFGLDPCQLCYYQRKPYMLNVALGLAAFLIAPKNRKATLLLVALCALSFAADAAIAAFHVGVEQKWWKGLESCANFALPDNATAEELRAFIMSREKPIDCGRPAFVLFGISMAGYNFIAATTLAVFMGWMAWRKK
jgi:disulfide bond formation protein DsbB